MFCLQARCRLELVTKAAGCSYRLVVLVVLVLL
jgi:hypothetical protein